LGKTVEKVEKPNTRQIGGGPIGYISGESLGARKLEIDSLIKLLEGKQNSLLLAEEELWRQRSRAIWIKSGDKNTKFFHHFANSRRNNKHLWEVIAEDGEVLTVQEDIKKEANKFFKSFFEEMGASAINDQVFVASLFPCLVEEEEALLLESSMY
jgi:hypothetical protein